MKHNALLLSLGLVIGTGLGWLAHAKMAPPAASSHLSRMASAASTKKPDPARAVADAKQAAPPISAPSPAPNHPNVDHKTSPAQLAELHQELSQLEDELSQTRAALRDLEQKQRPAPFTEDKLPPRLRPERLRPAINQALRDAKLAGEVQAMDCSGLLCLFVGDLGAEQLDREIFDRIIGSPAMQAYSDDKNYIMAAVTNKDGQAHSMFGLGLCPKGDDAQSTQCQAEAQDLHSRFEALFRADLGPTTD